MTDPPPVLDVASVVHSDVAPPPHKPLRIAWLGFVLMAIGAIVGIGLFVGLIVLWTGDHGEFPRGSAIRGMLLLIGLVVFPLFYLGAKLRARSASDVLTADNRAPVLYLRSFRSDKDEFGGRWVRAGVSLMKGNASLGAGSKEENLVELLQGIGPVVAVGKPGETFQTLGAARMYLRDDEWQAKVEELSSSAAMSVLRVGQTNGFWWEVDRVARTINPQRILFALTENELQFYDEFRERASAMLPRPLPPSLGDGRFIWFDAEWRPLVLNDSLTLMFDRRPPVFYIDLASDPVNLPESDAIVQVMSEIGPVIAIGKPGQKLPASAAAWMTGEPDEAIRIANALTWRTAPVVIRLADDESVVTLVARAVNGIEPQRLIAFVPGQSSRTRRRNFESLRTRLNAVLPKPMPTRFAGERFLLFGSRWEPRFLPRTWGWRRWKCLLNARRASRRIDAPALQPIFDRFQRTVPGSRIARRYKIAALMAIFALLGLTVSEQNTVRPLDLKADLRQSWDSFVWGAPATTLKHYFPQLRLDDVDATSGKSRIVSTGTSRMFAGIEMPLHLIFVRARLVGTALWVPHSQHAQLPKVQAALSEWLGPPKMEKDEPKWRREPVSVSLKQSPEFDVIMFVNEPLALEFAGDESPN
jgi:hypothetical protein